MTSLTWDEAMAKAIDLANRLDRPCEVVQNYPTGFSVRIVNGVDPVRGNIVTPGTPKTAEQLEVP